MIHPFIRRIYGIYLNLTSKNQKTTTCKCLNLETLGFFDKSGLKISQDLGGDCVNGRRSNAIDGVLDGYDNYMMPSSRSVVETSF